MTKIQKMGPDEKLHYYWHFSEKELAKTKEMKEKKDKSEKHIKENSLDMKI